MTDDEITRAVTAKLTGEFHIDQQVRCGVPWQTCVGIVVDKAGDSHYWVLQAYGTTPVLYPASQLRPL